MRKMHSVTCVVIFIVLALASCKKQPGSSFERANSLLLPQLPGAVVSVDLSNDLQAAVVVTSQSNTQRLVYVIDLLNQQATRVLGAEFLTLTRVVGKDQFLVSAPGATGATFSVYDFKGRIVSYAVDPTVTLIDIWPNCETDGTLAVCAGDRPGLKEDSPDFDALGFTAFRIIDLEKKTHKVVPVPFKTMSVDFNSQRILIGDLLNENDGVLHIKSYNFMGRYVGASSAMHGTRFSPSGRYYVPQLHEGGLPWEVFESKTNRPIMNFHEQPQVDSYNYFENGWNPLNDDLIVVESVAKSAGTIEVYNIRTRARIMSLREKQFRGWTADGKRLIFDDGRVLKLIPVDLRDDN